MIPPLKEKADELAELCRRHHVAQLEVFGSAATGERFTDESDIDFLVIFHPLELGSGQYVDAYFGLLESLRTLFGRPIDLVTADSITNKYFLESVNETRTMLYAA